MLKYLAISMLFMICTYLGYYFGERYKERSFQLKELQKAVLLLNTEVIFSNTPLPQALLNVSNKIANPFSKILNKTAINLEDGLVFSVYDGFNKSYEEYKDEISLKKEDYKILSDFFEILGESGVIGQEKIFKLTMDSLAINCLEAEKEAKVNTKMYRTLGLCFGIVFAIFFI